MFHLQNMRLIDFLQAPGLRDLTSIPMLQNASSRAILYRRSVFLRHYTVSIASQKTSALKSPSRITALPSPPQKIRQQCYFYSTAIETPVVVDDTIYALSTASGRAGIAVVRISGPSCLDIYESLCPNKSIPNPRYASLRTLYDPREPTNILDSDALVLYFQAPKTVTGEDILELHIHGGPTTVKAVLSAIPRCASKLPIRYAEPGEFTRRAFQNDRLDLAQVEALSDTLSAETEQQRRAAVRGSSGSLGQTYDGWRHQLLYARGELEALIDFSEDQHFDESPADLMSSITAQVKVMLESIASHERASHRGELLKRGIRISLLGPPNAGKSSLLNQIVGREASIVSREAGTTRDIVEVSLDIRGYLCTFADTAGLRTKSEESLGSASVIGAIEQEGIRRAKAKASESDVIIALASIEPTSNPGKWYIRYDTETVSIAAKAPQSLLVVNKCDSVSPEVLEKLLADIKTRLSVPGAPLLAISCKEAQTKLAGRDSGSINLFVDSLVKTFENMTELPTDMEDLLGVTERQRQLLSSCSQHLTNFVDEASTSDSNRGDESDIVLAAEHLRSAANCLSRITGRGEVSDVEEVLGVVFEKFCVGK